MNHKFTYIIETYGIKGKDFIKWVVDHTDEKTISKSTYKL